MNNLAPALDLLRQQLGDFDRFIAENEKRAQEAFDEHKKFADRVDTLRSQRNSLADAIGILDDEVVTP